MMLNSPDKQAEIIHNFRRCHLKGCLGMGYWSPVISISPDSLQRAFLPFPHLLMCDAHKDSIELSDLIDGPLYDGRGAWETIQGAFARAGKAPPQKEFTKLLWRPS
jgi:hypothetical protein